MSETLNDESTPGPWNAACGHYGRNRVHTWEIRKHVHTWEIRKHEFPNAPFEGDLDNEWGIYPPLGESGPVALVAGEANARLIAESPALLAELKKFVAAENPDDESTANARAIIARIEGQS